MTEHIVYKVTGTHDSNYTKIEETVYVIATTVAEAENQYHFMFTYSRPEVTKVEKQNFTVWL